MKPRHLLVAAACLAAAVPALADEPTPTAPDAAAAPVEEERQDDYANVLGEIGLFGGAFFPSSKHELYELDVATHKELDTGPGFGLRAGLIPHRNLGVELEGAMFASSAEGETASLYALRAHVLGQVPDLIARDVTPFAVLGGGVLGVTSDSFGLGEDSDPALHAGVGVKYRASRVIDLRLEYRHDFADGLDEPGSDGTMAGHEELLLGVSLVLGRPKPLPPDTDRDGFRDPVDECPEDAGIGPDGCPDPDPDRDGFADEADACEDEAGTAPDGCPDPDGDGFKLEADRCPEAKGIAPDGCPDLDLDKDGVNLPADLCPETVGIAPDGCPDLDLDRDGVKLPDDKCPDTLETKNGFQDDDGCPDELPKTIAKFTGAIGGLNFASGKATLTKDSYKTLDEAVKVLTEFPAVKLEVSGHTDAAGAREANVKLSAERAEAVKTYLTGKGVEGARITTRGAGPDEPVADNKTKAGQAKNRRIEFKLLP